MKREERKHHLFGTIQHSKRWIAIVVFLIILVFALFLYARKNALENSLAFAFIVGICSSAIVTFVFKISEKYNASVEAMLRVRSLSTVFLEYFDEKINESTLITKELKFDFLNYYFEVCRCYDQLTYKKDYNDIASILKSVIDEYSQNDNYDRLIELRGNLQKVI